MGFLLFIAADMREYVAVLEETVALRSCAPVYMGAVASFGFGEV